MDGHHQFDLLDFSILDLTAIERKGKVNRGLKLPWEFQKAMPDYTSPSCHTLFQEIAGLNLGIIKGL